MRYLYTLGATTYTIGGVPEGEGEGKTGLGAAGETAINRWNEALQRRVIHASGHSHLPNNAWHNKYRNHNSAE